MSMDTQAQISALQRQIQLIQQDTVQRVKAYNGSGYTTGDYPTGQNAQTRAVLDNILANNASQIKQLQTTIKNLQTQVSDRGTPTPEPAPAPTPAPTSDRTNPTITTPNATSKYILLAGVAALLGLLGYGVHKQRKTRK